MAQYGARLDGEYINTLIPIDIICSCGHKRNVYFPHFMNPKDKHLCGMCANTNFKLTTRYVRKMVESFGCELVGEFIKTSIKITIKCPCGNTRRVLYSLFISDGDTHRCKKCSSEMKSLKFEQIERRFNDNGFYLLNLDKVVGGKSKTDVMDIDGYKYVTSLKHMEDIKKISFSLRRFSKDNPYTLGNMNIWARKEGMNFDILKFCSYKSGNPKVTLKCHDCGNEWETIWQSVFTKGSLCSECVCYNGEKEIKSFLKNSEIEFSPQYKMSQCKNIHALRFDFYLSDYGVLCEYDGIQHFEPIDFAGKGIEWAKKQFKETQEKDVIKTKYCLDHNIPLLRIPYWDFNRIPEILTEYLDL